MKKRLAILFVMILLLPINFGKENHKLKEIRLWEIWTTSWYGEQFQGNKMANGQVFDMYALVVAHKELPFGTKIRITNLLNGKSVKATVKDRGPFIAGRDLDVSYGTAQKLGFVDTGVADMKVEIIQK